MGTSGGFGAGFGNDSLLAKYRPDLLHLPTTNGEHCTGDAIKMGNAVNANSVDLEWVQVHPTGLVKPDDPDAEVKFLAAEALRGVGGLVLDMNGKRFANELGRRDYVTGEMWKNKPPFRLCLNKAASDEIMWHCKHYTGRGVMKYYASGADLAKDMGVPLQTLVDTHEVHYEASVKTAQDPDGGSWPAYPSGKSWDEPSGKTGSGKKFYHNVIQGSQVATEPFYVAIITPVIHYCMGGLETTVKGECVRNGKALPGLYVAGEAAGGVHGNNRLGGVETKEYGPVILTSGGFGADFGNDSLLAKYRPDLLHLPTTNGEHCTGDAIKMGEAVGANSVDLEWVQVHPTGLVKPDDPDAKVKFLAAEALRGVGGIVLDAQGKRFANELGRRDYVTGEMWKNKPPFRLCLNEAASDEIMWHCKHYTGRG